MFDILLSDATYVLFVGDRTCGETPGEVARRGPLE